MDSILERKKTRGRYIYLGFVFFALILFTLILTVGLGAMQIGCGKSLYILWGKLTGSILKDVKANAVAVVWMIRLPRLLCSIFVGMGLAVAGAIFQSILGNPLADPYTLGVSTGAAFGASVAILCNILFGVLFPTTAFAFTFAFLTLLLVLFIAGRGGGLTTNNLIIAGIIISAILSAGISYIKVAAGEEVSAIVFWIMGSLVARQWKHVFLVMPTVLVATLISCVFANDLNVMTLGDIEAQSLGVNTKQIRLLYLVLGSFLTAACVSVSGVIGFVGLIIPHLLRMWLTADNRVLIPLAALLGGLLLMLADNATRLFAGGEIPVGVLTTLLGGPFFLYIFSRKTRRQL
ncbi:MAG: iron ABC transporter permease [Firmicutes bacterium]|nr:iron ABC transporter permease [Bacillota bacterium]